MWPTALRRVTASNTYGDSLCYIGLQPLGTDVNLGTVRVADFGIAKQLQIRSREPLQSEQPREIRSREQPREAMARSFVGGR